MGQKSNNVAMRDAQIKLRREEFALGMGRRESANYAAAMDAQIKLSKEECALRTGQRSNDAASVDAPIKSQGRSMLETRSRPIQQSL